MYSFKEKKLHYNRLQNQSAALADLKLLRSINPDAPVLPAWERSPERFANKILYLLLDYATAEQKEPAQSCQLGKGEIGRDSTRVAGEIGRIERNERYGSGIAGKSRGVGISCGKGGNIFGL